MLTRIVLLLSLMASPVLGVSTSYWSQTTEADFNAGTLDNVVATNLGDLKLSRAIKTLLEEDPQISSVYAMAEAPDGTIYAGTGPHGVLMAVKGDKVTTVAKLEEAKNIFSLCAAPDGSVLIGTGGDVGRVLKIDKPGAEPHELFKAEGVQYIWALVRAADGMVYAATGPTGQLYEIKPDGSSHVLLDTDENNLLSMISDGKDMLYIGTDPHGLVYRVNRKTGDSFILYNAAESEVSALALDKKGNLYAGTAEAREEPPAAAPEGAEPEGKMGRPEGGATGVPIPPVSPKPPNPPAPPDPNPGRPDPIPKAGGVDQTMLKTSFLSARAPVIFAEDRWSIRLAQDAPDAPGKKRPPHAPAPSPGPGKPQPPPGGPVPSPQPSPATAPAETPEPGHQPSVNANPTGEPRPEGNAVYKIDPDGFVTEVFRQPVLVLSMVENNGALLIATGSEGTIYQVKPDADETLALAKVDPKQVLCLLAARDGQVYMGMANVGSIATMSDGFADEGTYTSMVLDASQISRFGKIQLHGALPAATALKVSTRSGNVKDPSEKSWSKWSDDVAAAEFLPVTSTSARFLQYRLTFTSENGKSTPVVEDVTIAYQVPNLPPQIKSVKIATTPDLANADKPPSEIEPRRVESARHQTIAWEAADPNNDTLQFSLYFRLARSDEWILLKDKLTDTSYDWDTRTVADGRYEIKVVASDALANPPGMGKTASRISDPVLVDNTPPVIGDLKWKSGQAVHIDVRVVDRSSTVAAVEYSVDSNKDWQFVLPVDSIYDSPDEQVSFDIKGLVAGRHQVTLRATDSRGNQAYENVFVTVEAASAAR